jgi:hypothetical protein
VAFVCLLIAAMIGEAGVPAWRDPLRERKARATAFGGQTGERDDGLARSPTATFATLEHNVLYSPLWMIGIAQSYRLFDWIDDRNFTAEYEVSEVHSNGAVSTIAPAELFPRSMRSVLLQAYMHDITWGRIPSDRTAEFKQALVQRFAQRYCRTRGLSSEIQVHATVSRLTRDVVVTPTVPVMAFRCALQRAVISQPEAISSTALVRSGPRASPNAKQLR